MIQDVELVDEETISIFVLMQIKKRGGVAMIMLPKSAQDGGDDPHEHFYDEKLISAFAKAYQWRLLLKKGKVTSLAEICHNEKVEKAYASRLYRLNFIAPTIVEAIVNGRQPSTLCLQDFMENRIPDLWHEQMEVFGFKG